MAKGFKHTGDPEKTSGTFDKLSDGNYHVTGIDRWISTDDSGNPIFSTSYGGDLKVAFEFKVTGEDKGLACSLRPAEFYAYALACGVELKGVNAKNRMSSKTLDTVKDLINTAGKDLVVKSKAGWVNYVTDATPPEGIYKVKFVRAHRKDFLPDNYEWSAGDYGFYLCFDFEIVGDGTGRPCLWDGYYITLYMNRPFVDSYINVDETVITSMDEGRPLWERNEKSGGPTLNVKKWNSFIEYFAPELFDHDWTVDPIKSEWGVNELVTPQTVIIKAALKAGKKVNVFYKQIKKNKIFDLTDLAALNPETLDEEVPVESVKPLNALVDYLSTKFGAELFDTTDPEAVGVFSDKGKEWAKEFLQPRWVEAGLEKKVPLATLTGEQQTALLNAFKKLDEPTPEGETW